MRIIKILLLLSIFCLPACQTQFKNVRSFDIKHKMCKAFVVVRQDWNYPLGFIDKEDNLFLIQTDLDTLGQIETIWPSPSGQKVIIESYGEGHQFITVYDVSALVERHDQSKMIEPIRTLDPYPFAFDNIKWVDDNRIQFSSPSDFALFDKELRRGKYSVGDNEEIERIWQYNIITDTFKEMKSQQ